MKISLYSPSLKSRKSVSFDAFIEQLKTPVKSHNIEQLRIARAFSNGKLTAPYRDKIPFAGFSSTYRTRNNTDYMDQYNGVVLLEINRLKTQSEAEALKDKIRSFPQVLLAFTGCSGLSLKILVRFSLPDGSLPTETQLVNLFHMQACRSAQDYFRMQIDPRIFIRNDRPDIRCRFSFDPVPYVNTRCVPILMNQPVEAPGTETKWEDPLYERQDNPAIRKSGLIFATKEETRSYYFSAALLQAMKVEHDDDPDIYRRNFIIAYMKGCFHSGIEEEQAVYMLLRFGDMRKHEQEVRVLFRAGYEVEKHFGKKPVLPYYQKDTLNVIAFLNRRYELRRNTLNNQVEYRKKLNFYTRFEILDMYVLNTMVIEALSEGYKIWDRDIDRYIRSSKIPTYNPVDKFLEDLPVWDGKDHIRDLAQTVPCEHPAVWTENFYTWFLGMVAGWKQLSKQHANSTLPLLIGSQACGKSTFCKRILPPELQDYYTDSIDIAKKQEAMLALTRYMLINIDEFDSVSTSYQSFLKHIVQKPVVNVRKPYETASSALRRYSSFIATCNNDDLLSDPTGSRRYLCVKITDTIDNNVQINYPQLYAQAVAALNHGEKYWFDVEHAAKTTEANREFDLQCTEERLLLHYFEPTDNEDDGKWMSPTEIYLDIRNKSKMKLGNKGLNAFGRIFKKHGFRQRRVMSGTLYLVKTKSIQ